MIRIAYHALLPLVRRSKISAGTKRRIAALAACAGILVASDNVLAQESQVRSAPTGVASRPFPTILVQLGDVLLAILEEWVASKFMTVRKDTVSFVNANHLPSPRTRYFEVPPLTLFVLTEAAPGLPARNLKRRREELDKRWAAREPDEHGFWKWKPREYLLVREAHQRPLNQPLIVDYATPESAIPARNVGTVHFYWTHSVSVGYTFQKSDVPESEWASLDARVLELLRFLDARQPLGSGK